MCDVGRGQGLVAYPRADPALQRVVSEVLELAAGHDIRSRDNLEDVHRRLSHEERYPFHYQVHLLDVPEGREAAAAADLYRLFAQVSYQQALRGDPDGLLTALQANEPPFYASPNGLWTNAGNGNAAHEFNLLTAHHQALLLLGWPNFLPVSGVRIGILDTGLDKPFPAGANVTTEINAMDYDDKANSANVEDGTGHGTLVTTLISSIARNADYRIVKAFNDNGCSTDWHLMVGLSLLADCDVVNISIESALAGEDFRCKAIGHAATSAVFEAVIQRGIADSNAIYVAAAGNGGRQDLSYPARFGQVVAVESINSAGRLSHFSNHIDSSAGQSHPLVFVAPGGDYAGDGSVSEEALAETQDGSKVFYGTSYATAYVTGAIAARISRFLMTRQFPGCDDQAWPTRDEILTDLKNSADRDPSWFTPEHGHGLVQMR
jgi:major intracellular serine protease